MIFLKSLLAVAVSGAVLTTAGCGGGGTAVSDNAGAVTASGLMSNTVSIASKALTGGQSITIGAHSVVRAAVPTAMAWSAIPLSAATSAGSNLVVSDANCAGATYLAPVATDALGEGSCQAILTVPQDAKVGTWRITNVAVSSIGSIGDYVDVTVSALPASGFQLIQSATPLTGYVNKPLSLNIPFTVNAGNTVSNVTYAWSGAAGNPSSPVIAGANNSIATVTPTLPGQYTYTASVTANVNGLPVTATGSILAVINPANVVDLVSAGVVQMVTPNSPVSLTGTIANIDSAMTYATSWRQISGPVQVNLSNANSFASSFIAPSTAGSYGFEFKVVKNQADGTQAITTAETTVVVDSVVATAFTVNAGDVQTIKTGSITFLKGSVGTQGTPIGITYSYAWSQVGATPEVVTLSNANTDSASFIPSVAGTFTFNLNVVATSADGATTVSSSTQVVASDTAPPAATGSFAFTANAGVAQSVAANNVILLAGKETVQGTATGVVFSYSWTQIGVTPAIVALSTPNAANASFLPTVAGVYGFRLTVVATLLDGTTRTATSDTQVIVGGVGNTFTVSAGDAKAAPVNTGITLPGVVTTQGTFSGATFSYAWTQVGSLPAATSLSNANSLQASFLPSVQGTYTFMLTVTAVSGGVTTTAASQTQVLATP